MSWLDSAMSKNSSTPSRVVLSVVIILLAAASCISSVAFLLWGLLYEGPAFYSGQECRMTYSDFQFLPLRVLPSPSPSPRPTERYRLLKFTDGRDPRHKHLYPISGSMVENYGSASHNPNRRKGGTKKEGRLLELQDNWCLLPPNNSDRGWKEAPHPHRGHLVLYVPGHWGSFSQARSLGAHGTRWTGPYKRQQTDQEIYESFWTGNGMHDGWIISDNTTASSLDDFTDWLYSPSQQLHLAGFVMDVLTLDFNEQGAALHASKLLRQAEFFARAVDTIVEGCHLTHDSGRNRGITIVAHSIGAWVVRIALKMHPHLSKDGWIRNLITLASPLASIPYAVDAGVHDIARHINDVGYNENDVTMISISGGLRDEMIPPQVCRIPSESNSHHHHSNKDPGLVSNAFLAPSIVQKVQYGMDHRAIVWCFDLLKVVREVIFSLVVSTVKGLNSTERMSVAQMIMKTRQEPNNTIYDEEVNNLHVRLMQENGYLRAVSIQLSAPYHLNSLLKLCIVAILLHTTVISPTLHYLRGRTKSCLVRASGLSMIDMAVSLLAVPSLVLVVTWLRQSKLHLLGSSCYGQECQLLLGTIFILSQLATLIYFFIVYGVCTLVAAICDEFNLTQHNYSADKTQEKSFGAIFLQSSMQYLCLFMLAVLPLTSAVCFAINAFIHGHEDIAWNRVAVASYCFISFLLLISMGLIVIACKPSYVNSKHRRSGILLLFLSLVKATFGKVLYAFSLSTYWGQNNLNSYDNFLVAMNSHVGMIGGQHNEMIMCTLTKLLPAFLVLMALRTHDIMTQNSTRYWKRTKQIARNGDASAKDSESKQLDSAKSQVMPTYNEPQIITIALSGFVCWYTWNVSVSFPEDDLVVPFYSFILFVVTYLRCLPFSVEVMNVCSAIMNNDLSLQPDSPKDHNKNE